MVDECSVIDQVAYCCKLIGSGKKTISKTRKDGQTITVRLLNNEIFPLGYGVSWIIKKSYSQYEIQLFNEMNQGCRFHLNQKELNSFGEYLSKCCEYMLAHGEPI